MICQCANPECSAVLDHRNGILLRFPKRSASGQVPANTHAVQHFWLCAACSQSFVLEYRGDQGVVMSLRWEKPSPAKQSRVIAAA